MYQRGFISILVIVGIVVLIGATGYFVVSRKAPPSESAPPTPPPQPQLPSSAPAPSPVPTPLPPSIEKPTNTPPVGDPISASGDQSFNIETAKLTTLKGDDIAYVTVSPNGRRSAYLREVFNGERVNAWIIDNTEVAVPFETDESYWSPGGAFNIVAPDRHFDSAGKPLPLYANGKKVEDHALSLAIYSPGDKRVAYKGERLTTFEENKELLLKTLEPDLKKDPECAARINECEEKVVKLYESMLKRPQLKSFYVLDGKKTEEYDEISGGIFSPDGKQFVWAAKKDNTWGLYNNGKLVRELPDAPIYRYYSYSFNELHSSTL